MTPLLFPVQTSSHSKVQFSKQFSKSEKEDDNQTFIPKSDVFVLKSKLALNVNLTASRGESAAARQISVSDAQQPSL